MKIYHRLCAAVCTALLLIPLAACSGGTRKSVQAGANSSGSGQTQIVGEVTSVVGNQVTLAVGTLNQSGKKSASSSALRSASSGSSSEAEDSGSSSDLITLTGESKTMLIPVGLSLTSGSSGNKQSGGTGKTQNSAGNGAQAAGGGGSGQGGGGTGKSSGGTGMTSGGTGSASMQTTQKKRDFSSITKGMILQVTEKTLSDGTQGIAEVAVLSE